MENSLVHYGILGMKWGIRRTDAQLARARGESKEPNKAAKAERKSASKNRRTLSDADIEKRIQRLEKEKKLKDLTDSDLSPGRKMATKILKSAGEKALSTMAAGAMAYGVKVALTKSFDVREAASYIATNPNKKK